MKLKILVADDSISIQKLVAMAFYNEDMDVEGISDGIKAYNYLTDFKPDLVMADIYLPGINGFELSSKIKSDPELQDIRVLLLTSDFEELDEIMYAESKSDGFISKPFKTEDIIKKVKGLLGEEAVAQTAAAEEAGEDGDLELEIESIAEPGGGQEEGVLELELESMDGELPQEAAAPSKPIELSAEDLVAPDPPKPAAPRAQAPSAEGTPSPEPAVEPQPSASQSAPAVGSDDFQDSLDELEQLFHQLTHRRGASRQDTEPESASTEPQSGPHPDLIRETLSYLGEDAPRRNGRGQAAQDAPQATAAPVEEATPVHNEPQPEAGDPLTRLVQKRVAALPEEIPGLSQTIVDTIRQVVKEVAPSVIRQVIRKEIERIRKSEQV